MLQSSCSFLISYPIKNRKSYISIGDLFPNWMCCIVSFIFDIASVLSISKVKIWGLKFHQQIIFQFFNTVTRNPFCKAFVEPKVIPPNHSNIISKPMMWQFMGYHQSHHIVVIICRLVFTNHIFFAKSYNTCILHCHKSILSKEHLVVFTERVFYLEFLFK